MHETGCSGLVHWDDPEGWDEEGAGRGAQDGEHMYTHGWFMSVYGKNHYNKVIQFSSVTQSCPTPWDPMNHSMLGLPVHHQLPEFTQTHVHRVGDAIQPSHPLASPSPPAPNPSLKSIRVFSNESTLCMRWPKYWDFQLQHQSFQWTPMTDLL